MTTAAMQQIASNNLGFSPSRCMSAAQHLFEKGYITYLRTDSVRYSDEFITSCKEHIEKNYGKEYYRGLKLSSDQNKDSQNGHESIHQTDLENTPAKLSQFIDGDELKLYKLIYNYSLAALFVPAKVKDTDVIIKNGIYKFKISGRVVTYESYLKLFNTLDDDTKRLPAMSIGDIIVDKKLYEEEKSTQPPQRYSEAGLVKLMQETGIGRPSSFSGTIETLKKREYITVEKKSVYATEKGIKLINMLVKYFPDIINTEYTSNMESKLDEIAAGTSTKLKELSDFWKDFEPAVLKAAREINKDKPKPKEAGKICPNCGKQLIIRTNKYGNDFICCSGFPKCRYTEKIETEETKKEEILIQCPLCGEGHMVKRKSKKGEIFWGCNRFPKCKGTMNETKMNEVLTTQNNGYNPAVDNHD